LEADSKKIAFSRLGTKTEGCWWWMNTRPLKIQRKGNGSTSV